MNLTITLTAEELETLLTSLAYSIERVRVASGTPETVRKANLDRLHALADKLRQQRPN